MMTRAYDERMYRAQPGKTSFYEERTGGGTSIAYASRCIATTCFPAYRQQACCSRAAIRYFR